MLAHIMAGLLALVTVGGLVYGALALLAARSFAHRLRQVRALPLGEEPAVSVLKPLRGADEELHAALRSHCVQQYGGAVEVLCGVRSAEDPAAAVVRAVQAEFPEAALRLVVCPEELGTSGKVGTLVQLAREARHEHVLVNDADIVVGPEYLRNILRWFSAPPVKASDTRQVGMVTAPYVGLAHAGAGERVPLTARLESLGISTEFLPGVLTARMLEGGIRFGLGSTLAMRADALVAIGGFAPLLESLADDYELGARIARAGWRVELAGEVVRTGVPAYTWRGLWDHQLRWARSTRDSRRTGYFGLGITYCLPWAVLTLVVSGGALWGWALLSMALLLRVAAALSVGVGLLGDGQVLRDIWLLPVRDGFGLVLWLWSFAGDTVVWRGERFRLRRGQLERLG